MNSLRSCLENNPQSDFTFEDIKQVLAIEEGVNDEKDWFWIVELNNNKVYFIAGWCDFTGWDCRSCADSFEINWSYFLSNVFIYRWASEYLKLTKYYQFSNKVRLNLLEQMIFGKNETWEDRMNQEFYGSN